MTARPGRKTSIPTGSVDYIPDRFGRFDVRAPDARRAAEM
jgi:hypothetical protein